MKKILAFLLCAMMLVSMLALVACGNEKKSEEKSEESKTEESKPASSDTLKFGAAVYVNAPTATDATADKAGQGSVDVTIAAVTVDKDGKIVACDLDTMQNKVSYDVSGKAIANESFKTKREFYPSMGENSKAWHEQADAFESVVAGKTVAEIKALIVEGNKGNDAVVNAGCTIMIHEFVNAIEKAVANAKTDVASDVTVKAVLNTTQTCTDATADKAGSNKVEIYAFGAALKGGKIVSADSDCVEVSFGFDITGKSTFDASAAINTKREFYPSMGENSKTWSEQADAFDAACEGKTGDEIAGLMAEDYKGIDSLQTAGCTIYVSGFVAVASKI